MAKPVRPEPKFFLDDAQFKLGLSHYRERYFKPPESNPRPRLLGEKSTSYCEYEHVAHRIATSFPAAKILFIVRNPIQRAISNYWFSYNHGLETTDMLSAFRDEKKRIEAYDRSAVSASPFAYQKRGHYIRFVETFERYFAPEQIKVIALEKLTSSLTSVQQLYAFLGVEPAFVPPSFTERINAGRRSEDDVKPAVHDLLRREFNESLRMLVKRFPVELGGWADEIGWEPS